MVKNEAGFKISAIYRRSNGMSFYFAVSFPRHSFYLTGKEKILLFFIKILLAFSTWVKLYGHPVHFTQSALGVCVCIVFYTILVKSVKRREM